MQSSPSPRYNTKWFIDYWMRVRRDSYRSINEINSLINRFSLRRCRRLQVSNVPVSTSFALIENKHYNFPTPLVVADKTLCTFIDRSRAKKIIENFFIRNNKMLWTSISSKSCGSCAKAKKFSFSIPRGLKAKEIDFYDGQNKSNGISHKAQ